MRECVERVKSNWAILPVSMIVTADTMGVENCVRHEARQTERERDRKRKRKSGVLKRTKEMQVHEGCERDKKNRDNNC